MGHEPPAASARCQVLDVCAGTRDFSFLAAREADPGGRVVTRNISPALLDAGRYKAAKALMADRVLWVQGDAERMGLARECFDAVLAGYGFAISSFWSRSFRK